MPFTMTHLIIAENLSKVLAKHINNLPQFYLGNIAPDAVHNRANYISDYKKEAHLCVGDEKWGMVTNNDEWINSVIHFLNKYKKTENHDFILGYCSHIMSDIYNNITEWIPFKQNYQNWVEKGYTYGLYREEINKLDIELALTYKNRNDFWLNLEKSDGVDLENIVSAAEIEKQKENILYLWFKDKPLQDISSNKIMTQESIQIFIKNAVDFIVVNLQKYL
jgi:hypothetical protein